jgi:hypothetical protein
VCYIGAHFRLFPFDFVAAAGAAAGAGAGTNAGASAAASSSGGGTHSAAAASSAASSALSAATADSRAVAAAVAAVSAVGGDPAAGAATAAAAPRPVPLRSSWSCEMCRCIDDEISSTASLSPLGPPSAGTRSVDAASDDGAVVGGEALEAYGLALTP